ncbi:hypothetical protein AVEN_190741-1 [Araneus ventricosus]|uniref:Uncharacterized protein n=1 Tax=Araneus ventricosus TaxID=182803 RepID=A0A4Y2Q7R9_ARAVE|nr:hypothetical protein AVEN_255812-1 [Araneus ventricosus]GBN60208.1 hypothetical protein AVEN_60435-1 [Araneus ventricosus]GBN60216.1 hypothetical protein AVEN_160219-1 [Araneus ventricosus]GBN60231.1 hypothetical protein AVEN_190741-1 [Araneus ventricosus]
MRTLLSNQLPINELKTDLAAEMSPNEFVATDGSFHLWRKRVNVVFKQTHEEQKSADIAAAERINESQKSDRNSFHPMPQKKCTMQTKVDCITEPCQAILIKGESTKVH